METETQSTVEEMGWGQRSQSICKLAEALCKAQGVIEAAKKDTKNEFFKSKYADLASIWTAVREPLSKNGLSVIQEPSTSGNRVSITTTLLHTSGEFVRSSLEVVAVKSDPQGIGSAITYARRYALGAIVGIAPEDDDGNAASGGGDRSNGKAQAQKVVPSLQTANQMQNGAAQQAFGNDNIQMGKIYHYDLKSYFAALKPAQVNAAMRLLEKSQGYDTGNDLWAVPEYVEGLKQYLLPEDSMEAA